MPIPTIWIIYGTFENMRDAFQRFVENVPFYGFAVLCLDHPEVQAMVGRITDRRMITYGFSPQADARAVNVRFAEGAGRISMSSSPIAAKAARKRAGTGSSCPCRANTMCRMPWPPSWWRAELGVSEDDVIRKALERFQGRRPPFLQDRGMEGRRHH